LVISLLSSGLALPHIENRFLNQALTPPLSPASGSSGASGYSVWEFPSFGLLWSGCAEAGATLGALTFLLPPRVLSILVWSILFSSTIVSLWSNITFDFLTIRDFNLRFSYSFTTDSREGEAELTIDLFFEEFLSEFFDTTDEVLFNFGITCDWFASFYIFAIFFFLFFVFSLSELI
jgi:hypothetical protein